MSLPRQIREELASRMEVLRDLSGASEKSISELAGLPPGHFNVFVARLRDPARESADIELGTLLRYCEVLGAPTEWLASGHGHVPTAKKVQASVAAARARAAKPAGRTVA